MRIVRVTADGIEYEETRLETFHTGWLEPDREQTATYRFVLSIERAESLLRELPQMIADAREFKRHADDDQAEKLRGEIAAKQSQLERLSK